MAIILKNDNNAQQFTATVGDQTAILKYAIYANGKTLDYLHTFVPEELRGKGIGAKLVQYSLNYAKDHQLKVIPSCAFVKSFIAKHQEYQSIVTY